MISINTASAATRFDAVANAAIASTIAAGQSARRSCEAAPVIRPCLAIARSDDFRQLLQDVGDVALALLWGLFAALSLACYAVAWISAEVRRLVKDIRATLRRAVAMAQGEPGGALVLARPAPAVVSLQWCLGWLAWMAEG